MKNIQSNISKIIDLNSIDKILFTLSNAYSFGFLHKNSDSLDYTENTIRIEMAGSSVSHYASADAQYQTGVLLWRDFLNNRGGLCIGGTITNNECVGGKQYKVEVVLWNLRMENDDADKYLIRIEEWIADIRSRLKQLKPNVIIAPYGDEYTLKTVEALSKYGTYGDDLVVFSGAYSESLEELGNRFIFSTAASPTTRMNEVAQFFINRVKVKKIGILCYNTTNEHLKSLASYFYFQVTNIDKSIQIPIKRCTSQASDPYGVNCESDFNCPAGDSCSYPIYNPITTSHLEQADYTKEWLKVFQSYDVELLYFISEEYQLSFLEEVRNIGYTPNAILIQKIYDFYNDALDFDGFKYFVYSTEVFDRDVIEVDTNEKYMGDPGDYVSYLLDNYEQYYNHNNNKNTNNNNNDDHFVNISDSLLFDYQYYAFGSSIGITIQRLFDYALTNNRISLYPDMFHLTSTFLILKNILTTQFGYCKNLITGEKRENVFCGNGNRCSQNTDACVNWNTFYGEINFNTEGINEYKKCALLQVSDEPNRVSFDIVWPSTIGNCNLNGKECTSDNNYQDCTCPYTYPAPWYWKINDVKESWKIDQVSSIVSHIISLICCILIIILSVKMNKKYKAYYTNFPQSLKFLMASNIMLIFAVNIRTSLTKGGCYISEYVRDISLALYFASFIITLLTISHEMTNDPLDNKTQVLLTTVVSVILILLFIIYDAIFLVDYYIVEEIIDYTSNDIRIVIAVFILLLLGWSIYDGNTMSIKMVLPLFIVNTSVYIVLYLSIFDFERNWDSRMGGILLVNVGFWLNTIIFYIPLVFRIKDIVTYADTSVIYPFNNREMKKLRKILHSHLGRHSISIFLTREGKYHKFVEFYLEAETHKSLPEDKLDGDEIRLFDKYLNTLSFHLDLPKDIIERTKIKLNLKNKHAFRDAQKSSLVYLQTHGCYKRYAQSIDFKKNEVNERVMDYLRTRSLEPVIAAYEYIVWQLTDRSKLIVDKPTNLRISAQLPSNNIINNRTSNNNHPITPTNRRPSQALRSARRASNAIQLLAENNNNNIPNNPLTPKKKRISNPNFFPLNPKRMPLVETGLAVIADEEETDANNNNDNDNTIENVTIPILQPPPESAMNKEEGNNNDNKGNENIPTLNINEQKENGEEKEEKKENNEKELNKRTTLDRELESLGLDTNNNVQKEENKNKVLEGKKDSITELIQDTEKLLESK